MGVRPVRSRRVVAFLAAALVAGGCERGADVPPSTLRGSQVVSFETEDGLRLAGRAFGDGTSAVVLAHMLPADQASWFPMAADLADRGYLVLTFDFRGYCPGGDAGCSEGEREIDEIWRDVEAAAAFLRHRGAERIALLGASMGGTASLVAASHIGRELAAVVTLSAPVEIEGLAAGPDVLSEVTVPALFVAGEDDGDAVEAARAFAAQAGGPAAVEVLPTDDHGTDLLEGEHGPEVRALLLEHLAAYAPPGEPVEP